MPVAGSFTKNLRCQLRSTQIPQVAQRLRSRSGNPLFASRQANRLDARMGRRGVSHVAFKVDLLSKARERLAAAGVNSRPGEPVGSASREVIWSDPKSTIGIPLQFAETDIKLDFRKAPKPKFIERMDHLGIACYSGEKAARDLYGRSWLAARVYANGFRVSRPDRDHVKRQIWCDLSYTRADSESRGWTDRVVHYGR